MGKIQSTTNVTSSLPATGPTQQNTWKRARDTLNVASNRLGKAATPRAHRKTKRRPEKGVIATPILQLYDRRGGFLKG
jgi:hypothetical protein